jgi:hypothetical protein
MRRSLVVVVVVAVVGGLAVAIGVRAIGVGGPGRAPVTMSGSYGWPVKPFFQQHAVRGVLGDPRIGPDAEGRMRYTLHLGVDVVAMDGTPVYATITGRVSIHPLHPDTVMVSDGKGRVFEYWHVLPTMTAGQATAYVTVIGHVARPWAHVNFSERVGSRYVNPLRPGGMGPYEDVESPLIGDVRFERGGRAAGRVLHGAVDVVASAYDLSALPVPAPWNDIRLTPAVVRWRVLRADTATREGWLVAFDTRYALPTASFSSVYATGTRQNRTYRPGWYRFYLAHGWDTDVLADGSYQLEVSALDIRGNEATATVSFVVTGL